MTDEQTTTMDLKAATLSLGHKPALILVDLINGFTDLSSPLGVESEKVLMANVQLLKAFRRLKLPVFFTTVVYHSDTQATVFRRKLPDLNILTPDSAWVEVNPALARREDEPLLEKQWASGFFATPLAGMLRERGVDSLVVTGLTTSGCVRATAVDGLQHDYPVIIPREAVGDRNAEAHAANLFDLNAKYAQVLTLDAVLSQLEGRSEE